MDDRRGGASGVRDLFDELSDLGPEERRHRLEELAPDVRDDMESLLEAHDRSGPFDALAGRLGEASGGDRDVPVPAEVIERLSSRLGDRYKIEREIGEGGMAVVYLAEDLRHERHVALKVLKPELAALVGADRFLAEIRTTAKLQHPHILPLFDSGEVDGLLYYVMPFVEDESLRQRLDRERQLPIPDAVGIAIDVAEALEHAHGAGVVHRDIKPDNILLTPGGAIVADFGIALLLGDAEETRRLTEAGVRLGTPRYMSPEQATGSHLIGAATDVYALGCVLYEMLAGVAPHRGRSREAILAERVSGAHAPVRTHRSTVSEALDGVVMRALEPIPADRHRSAGAFASALRSAAPAAAQDVGPRRRWLLPTAAAAVAVAGVAWALSSISEAPVPGADPVVRQVTFEGDLMNASLSPDGRLVAFVAGREGGEQRIAFQPLQGGSATSVYEGARAFDNPQWSPNGEHVALTGRPPGWTYLLSRQGTGLADSVPSNHVYTAWGPSGDRLLGWSAKRADVSVLDLSTRTLLDSIPFGFPIEWVLGASWSNAGDRVALSIVTDDLDGVWTLDLASGALVRVVGDTLRLRNPIWSPDDEHLYYARYLDERDAEIWRVGVAADGRAADEPQRVFGPAPMFSRHGIQPPFSLSADGASLLYLQQLGVSNLLRVELGADEGSSTVLPLTSGTADRSTPRLSPDGRSVAYVRTDSRGSHVAILDLGTGESRQLTFLDGNVWSPAWSEGGGSIAFGSNHEGSGVWTVDVGDGSTRALSEAPFEAENHIGFIGSSTVAVQMPGDRTVRLFPARAPSTAPLDLSGDPPLIYDLRPSPNGQWLAVFGAFADGVDGLWLLSADGETRRALAEAYTPVGWTDDGSGVYAMPGARALGLTEIHVVPVTGEPPTHHVTLPIPVKPWELSISGDGRTIVGAVEEPRADAWVVEGFDPGAR